MNRSQHEPRDQDESTMAQTYRKPPASPSHGLFSVAGVMRRIRVEASLKGSARDQGAPAAYMSDPFSMPNWASAESHPAIKPQYELPELLRASDIDFVVNAYQAVLRRPADAIGLESFVAQLRSGSMDKVDVLSELRWSEEGVRRGVHINGLLAPHLLRKWGRKPVIGPLLRWAHAILTVHQQESRLQQAENILGRDVQDLGRHVGALGDKFGETLQRHEDTLAILHEQLQRLQHERRQLTADRRDLQQTREALSTLRAEWSAQTEAQSSAIASSAARLGEHDGRLAANDARVGMLEARRAEADAALAAARARAGRLGSVYAEFEDEFRGPREQIRARLQPYVALLQAAGKGGADQPVLDLGAGRGEWLQMLGEAGLSARGVDTNDDFVVACRELGLDVSNVDAVSALESTPRNSLGAVTTMHLVEHLPFEDVVALIDGSLHALQPGGVLIIETPNPENLRVGSYSFYLDPTHRNPVPPIMLRWLVENRGFSDVQIMRLSEHRPWPHLPRLPASSEAAESLNPLLEWAEIAPDYAIVARKPHD